MDADVCFSVCIDHGENTDVSVCVARLYPHTHSSSLFTDGAGEQ